MSPAVSLQLFCLPYSGASATLFLRWQPSLPGWIRLLPLELPGRGLRFGEALHTDAASLVVQLASELHGTLDSAPARPAVANGRRSPRAATGVAPTG